MLAFIRQSGILFERQLCILKQQQQQQHKKQKQEEVLVIGLCWQFFNKTANKTGKAREGKTLHNEMKTWKNIFLKNYSV